MEAPRQTLSSRLPRLAVGAKPRDLLFHLTPSQCVAELAIIVTGTTDFELQ
jgi:hypothetical protein